MPNERDPWEAEPKTTLFGRLEKMRRWMERNDVTRLRIGALEIDLRDVERSSLVPDWRRK